ncbi:WYL domain-containing protein [Xylophilus sp. GOD-11R]|uniref:WYL domain-containing protein n=1 Tax=Xylophilus sp. GOD-11R TaxID=3089814 RepID=UPI00298C1382|nr:WYL domain-containing protein [Xylophilus sp. GOD-11R]WPB56680.1 hypothetical protein R9X41_21470 [Xylophilus sp. GOD-11R]
MPSLIDAILERRAVAFVYRGARRTVEPHAVGIGHDGAEWLSAYQTAGKRFIPGHDWIYCSLRSIEELQVTTHTFEMPRPGYSRGDSRFIRFFAEL